MKGIWKMLTGQGEREYRQEHQAFRDAIPEDYPFRAGDLVRTGPRDRDVRQATLEDADLPEHPAYSEKYGNTLIAANYRRSLPSHGPRSKRDHAGRAALQKLQEQYENEAAYTSTRRMTFQEWLQKNGIPLPEGE